MWPFRRLKVNAAQLAVKNSSLLVGMGAAFAPALVAVLVYRLFNFWLPIVPALALMPTIRDLRQRFHRAERQAS